MLRRNVLCVLSFALVSDSQSRPRSSRERFQLPSTHPEMQIFLSDWEQATHFPLPFTFTYNRMLLTNNLRSELAVVSKLNVWIEFTESLIQYSVKPGSHSFGNTAKLIGHEPTRQNFNSLQERQFVNNVSVMRSPIGHGFQSLLFEFCFYLLNYD